MFRCIKLRRSVLYLIRILNCENQQFHVSSQMYVRRTRNTSTSVEPEGLQNNFDPSLMQENINTNFLGIESDEGVIKLGPPQVSFTQSTTRTNNKEKFHITSFGIMRFDEDNKIKFHGQYHKENNFSFPRCNDDFSEVLRKQSVNKSVNYSKRLHNKQNNKNPEFPSPGKKEQNVSYVDDYYFGNISESDKTNYNKDDIHPSSKDLNFVDKNYFETLVSSENLKSVEPLHENKNPEFPSPEKKELNASYIDDDYFGNISKRDKSNYNKDDIHPSSKDINFVDKNYFETLVSSENVKSVEPLHDNENPEFPSPEKKELNASYIDDDYFGNISERDKSNYNKDDIHPSLKDLNFVDKKYFETLVSSENLKSVEPLHNNKQDNKDPEFPSPEKKELNTSYIDDCYFDNISEREKTNYNKDNIHPTSIMDRNHFETLISSENLKSVEHSVSETDNVNYDHSYLPSKELNSLNKNYSKSYTSESSTSKKERLIHFDDGQHCTDENVIQPVEQEIDQHEESAHKFVEEHLRKEQEDPQRNNKDVSPKELFDSKGFRILKNQVLDLSHLTRDEILNILKTNVVYSDDDLLVLNKPYGLVIHESKTTKEPCLSTFLSDLAKEMDRKTTDPKLFTVHRLDKETTGCLLLARKETAAQYLKSLFVQRKVIKRYWIVTSKVPDPLEGVIDIPISEGSIDKKKRMVLHAKIPKDIAYRNHSHRGKEAITSYKVIAVSGNAALIEVFPETGIKHQIRVHFGFGLSCPIIGDHKYSHLDKLAPQKLPSDILQRLGVRQSKVRYIPMHIHAKSITIPNYFDGRDLVVNIPLPKHIITNLKRLKFRKGVL